MDKQSVVNQFNEYYIKQNRIKHIENLSYNLPLNKIAGLNKNQIIIGSTTVNIPENLLENTSDDHIKLDAFTNDENCIYYVNSHYKKYYKIGNDISMENYILEENEILNFNFKYEQHNDLACHFVVIEFSEEKGILARKYKDLNQVSLLPHSETKYLKVYLVPENEGFIYNIDMQISKENMVILNDKFLEINSDIMYNPDARVMLSNKKDSLFISVPELNKKFIYFSYAIENNSFNKVPKQSLIKIDPNNLYKLTAPFKLYEQIDFTPTVIEYNKHGKTNLIKLTNDSQFIKFQNDTTAVRLSYRFSGTGKVEVQPINIIEYETETEFEDVYWNSRYEIDTHMKTIKNVKDLRMAVIMDEFTYHSYKYEADLLRLTFDNWKNEILSFMPHFIFIESSWHGNNGDWSKKIAYVTDEKHSYIKKLISFAQSLNIPVVFWNKEDPVHYDHFIHTAKLCDFVFTTDRDRVEDYKTDCNHENVDVLQFAAQPVNHNPIKIQKERIDGISFAGSYYGLREERSKDMDRLFRASIPHNLYIYDRNYEFTKKGERLNFLFPEEFRKYILGVLPFYEIEKAYKGYKYMININTVKTSPTMYARRVYEGLASGTPIISNYSLGMEKQFGDIIGYSENVEELNDFLVNLNNKNTEYNKVKQLGIRRVLENHTYEQRLLQICKSLGYDFEKVKPTVTCISFSKSDEELISIIDNYNYINYENKSLIIISDNLDKSYSLTKGKITIIKSETVKLFFETINKVISADFIAPICANDFYGKNYLSDLLLARKYSYADIIGKSSRYFYKKNSETFYEENTSSQHEYTSNLKSYSSIFKSEIFSNHTIIDAFSYLDNKINLKELDYLGVKMFSSDNLNYIKNGKAINQEIINKIEI